MSKAQQALAEADAAVLNALLDASQADQSRPVDLKEAAVRVGLSLDMRRTKPNAIPLDDDPRARWSAAILLGSVLFARRGGSAQPACKDADLEQPWPWWQLDEQRSYAYAFASALLLPARLLLTTPETQLAQHAVVPDQVAADRLNPPEGRILDDVNWKARTFVLAQQPESKMELV